MTTPRPGWKRKKKKRELVRCSFCGHRTRRIFECPFCGQSMNQAAEDRAALKGHALRERFEPPCS